MESRCLDCIFFSPLGGGKSGVLSFCKADKILWSDCRKFEITEKALRRNISDSWGSGYFGTD